MTLEVNILDKNKEIVSTETHEITKGEPVNINIEDDFQKPTVEAYGVD